MIVEILGFIFSTFIFVIYIEHDIGNIVFRQDSSGEVVFTLYGLLSYLIDPLTNSFLWNCELLRYNYIVWIIIYSFVVYCIYIND
jgi:hypothetical protein